MNDLQHEFIRQSVADLHSLAEKSRQYKNEVFPADFLREIFRVLHTIKGTSQVFGLAATADLAHTLENLLAAAKNNAVSAESLNLLSPVGVEILADSLAEKSFQIPDSFAEKIEKFRSGTIPLLVSNENLHELPAEFFGALSAQEKILANAAVSRGKNLFVLEIGFEAANFSQKFKDFRAALAEKGEIIAALPSAKFAAQKKIGFQIVYAADDKIEAFVEENEAEIIFQRRANNFDDLPAICAQIAAHGKTLAAQAGKTVEFEIRAATGISSFGALKIVFDALTHLVRNAVSHAFDVTGKITIEAKNEKNKLIVHFSDDGKGLDLEKIRRAAIEKNLVSEDRNLSETELTNLIFAPDFSTAAGVSDVAGRGVGLDAVKTLVENAGGKISVESKMGTGTTFEIFLPLNSSTQNDDEKKTEIENETDKI